MSKTKITVFGAEWRIWLKASDITKRETDVKIQREVFGKIIYIPVGRVGPNADTRIRWVAYKRTIQ